MNTSIQKIIKIGSSAGVTIPAKELKRLDLSLGDEVEISYKKKITKSKDSEVVAAAKKILKKYDQDFKNLANR